MSYDVIRRRKEADALAFEQFVPSAVHTRKRLTLSTTQDDHHAETEDRTQPATSHYTMTCILHLRRRCNTLSSTQYLPPKHIQQKSVAGKYIFRRRER